MSRIGKKPVLLPSGVTATVKDREVKVKGPKGELSLRCRRLRLLVKSLRPLPDKWHGLADVESRYRQRYVDLIVNPHVREVFVKRNTMINSMRSFLNRRGYAPTLFCSGCGWIAACKSCDARLTVHQSRAILACHHCGAEETLPYACPRCGNELAPVGEGTERVETALPAPAPSSVFRSSSVKKSPPPKKTSLPSVNLGPPG